MYSPYAIARPPLSVYPPPVRKVPVLIRQLDPQPASEEHLQPQPNRHKPHGHRMDIACSSSPELPRPTRAAQHLCARRIRVMEINIVPFLLVADL